MSSWFFDWERSILPAARLRPEVRERGKYRTHCKLGRHSIMELDPARYITDSRLAPLGISCLPCLKERAAELGLEVPAEPEPLKVPGARSGAAGSGGGGTLRDGSSAVGAGPKGPGGRPTIPPELWVHGKASTYIKRGCRCNLCREANATKSREDRARRKLEKAGLA